MTLPQALLVNASLNFPATVKGAGPIAITKVNGIWTVTFTIAQLAQIPLGFNPATNVLIVYDLAGQIFRQVTLRQVVLDQMPEYLGGSALNVNLNSANTDTAIPIVLPDGVTSYMVSRVVIKNKGTTASLTTATAGVFTAAAAGGTAVAANQALAAITSNAANTAANAKSLTLLTAGDVWYTAAQLFFRVGTAQGAAATGDVFVYIKPLS